MIFSPFSLWEKGWGKGGVAGRLDTQALSQRERESGERSSPDTDSS